jgi:hypothetical protein
MATAVAAGIIATLLTASTAAAATSGTATVTARVRAFAAVTQTDAQHVLVTANTPWTLEVVTGTGRTMRIEGAKTPGTVVELPADATAYSLVWD